MIKHYIQANKEIPNEITDFLTNVFCIYEIRANIGKVNNLKFEIRPKESNHNIPHIHASYAEYNISIAISDGKVLAGNLPKKQEKIAIDWVLKNKESLLNKWFDIVVNCNLPFTKSAIRLKETV